MLESIVLGLHLLSHHFPAHDYQENFNPGIYARDPDTGLTGGIYRNTLGRTSVYVGKTFGDEVALTVGGVTGYQIKPVELPVCDDGRIPGPHGRQCVRGSSKGAIALMVAPSVRLGPARLSLIPGIGNTSTVLHLSVEHRF